MPTTDIFQVHDEDDFATRVLTAKDAVIVGFFAPDCETCDTIYSRTEQVIEENKEKVSMAKVNIDDLSELSQKYGVVAGPVLAVAQNGKILKKLSGMPEIDEIRKFVKSGIGEGDD
ncbi:hypothetical protein PVAND_017505 [Polypedilum vanderplanki]|uniref:Thioredoxin n=1 Tax=Polypedilum vanderplanki TaxID=319348 RepID=S6BTP9_POLVA|nr:hypothetical protein PVAND_017505 [Polypedilum vanderplanki]BAN67612.1 thioredoxin [Polypedilum vanderplanki]